jgi:hypothetical protein
VRPVQQRREAEALISAGVSLSETSRRTGIPYSTVRGWQTGRIRPIGALSSCAECGHPEHDFAMLPAASYAYLLGAYLGDGHISRFRRGVFRLTIHLDKLHAEIAQRCAQAMREVVPKSRVLHQPHHTHRLTRVSAYSKQWPCLLPQHGPGRKHDRQIILTPWQNTIVERAPGPFVKGLIETDGCRATNTVRHGDRESRYTRYQFSNRSQDIKDLFCHACDLIGVKWRVMNAMNISVARRDSVAILDQFIGPKR